MVIPTGSVAKSDSVNTNDTIAIVAIANPANEELFRSMRCLQFVREIPSHHMRFACDEDTLASSPRVPSRPAITIDEHRECFSHQLLSHDQNFVSVQPGAGGPLRNATPETQPAAHAPVKWIHGFAVHERAASHETFEVERFCLAHRLF
jgi:hypothetical protein